MTQDPSHEQLGFGHGIAVGDTVTVAAGDCAGCVVVVDDCDCVGCGDPGRVMEVPESVLASSLPPRWRRAEAAAVIKVGSVVAVDDSDCVGCVDRGRVMEVPEIVLISLPPRRRRAKAADVVKDVGSQSSAAEADGFASAAGPPRSGSDRGSERLCPEATLPDRLRAAAKLSMLPDRLREPAESVSDHTTGRDGDEASDALSDRLPDRLRPLPAVALSLTWPTLQSG